MLRGAGAKAATLVTRLAHATKVLPYVVHSEHERAEMLETIGVSDEDQLFTPIPAQYLLPPDALKLPEPKSEIEIMSEFQKLARKNLSATDAPCFLGAGIYRHHIPSVVDHLIQRSEFLTAYTPYQPEVSQGTLTTVFEFQNYIALLTGMEIANASMYDGSTATAEAVNMAVRLTKRRRVVLDGNLHPHYTEVVDTYVNHSQNADLVHLEADPSRRSLDRLIESVDDKTSCVVVQNPAFFGGIQDLRPLAEACHAHGALLVAVVNEPVSFGLLESPGAMGADIVCGDCGSMSGPLAFGGPTCGFFAAKGTAKFMRAMPGRLVGETVDADGERAYVLTLGTREQHIRRDKATSNICTAAGLQSMAFAMHVTALGEEGYRGLAEMNHTKALKLHEAVERALGKGCVVTPNFFNEFTIKLPEGVSAQELVSVMAERNVLGGVPVSRLLPNLDNSDSLLIVAATELVSEHDLREFTDVLREAVNLCRK